jgi:hypothetical protein
LTQRERAEQVERLSSKRRGFRDLVIRGDGALKPPFKDALAAVRERLKRRKPVSDVYDARSNRR